MRNNARSHTLIGSILLLLGVCLLTPPGHGGTAHAEGSPSDADVLVNGYLLDDRGMSESGSEVILYSFVSHPDGPSESIPITRTHPLEEGYFSFSLDSSGLSRDFTGSIPLEIGYTAANGRGLFYDFRLVPESDVAAWQMELPPTAVQLDPEGAQPLAPLFQLGEGTVDTTEELPAPLRPAARQSRLYTQSGPVRIGKGSGEGKVYSVATAASATAGPAVVAGDGREIGQAEPDVGTNTEMTTFSSSAKTNCDGVMPVDAPTRIVWHETGHKVYRYLPTKLIITKGLSKQQWTFSRTNETVMTITENVGGDKFTGGIAGINSNRIFKVEWEYRQIRAHCDYVAVTSPPQDQPAIDIWHKRPYKVMTGNVFPDSTLKIDCGGPGPTYNSFYAVSTAIGTSSYVAYNGQASISGVGINVTQRDGDGETFLVKPTDSTHPAKLCGSNGDPGVADLVREVAQ